MTKIIFYSGLLRRLFNFLSVVYPLGLFLLWLFFSTLPEGLKAQILTVRLDEVVWNTKTLLLSFLVTIPQAFFSWAFLRSFAKLFEVYAQGKIFLKSNCVLMHDASKFLALCIFTNFLLVPCRAFILTFQNPPGQRILQLLLTSYEVSWLIAAAMLWILSKIQLEASLVFEDSELTI